MPEVVAQHHKYSASGSSSWSCSGKLVMEDGIPESYSPYADEGSAAHFLAAEVLSSGRTVESYHHFGVICYEQPNGRDGQCFYGEPLPKDAVERSRWKVDKSMVEHITKYVDYVRGQVKGGTLLVEQRVAFGALIGAPGAFGTSDVIILSENREELIIIDLKYGFREVSAEFNSQMLLYSLGALHTDLEDPDDLTGGYLDLSRVKSVKMVIFQPRLQSEPDCPEWTCDLDKLYAFAGTANIAIVRCEQAAAESEMLDDKYSAQQWVETYLKPSEKACQWCRAKSSCPAIARECLEGVLMPFGSAQGTPLATDEGLVDLDRSAPLTASAEPARVLSHSASLTGTGAEPARVLSGAEALATNSICVPETEDLASGVQQAIAKIPTLDFATINRLYSAKGLFKTWSEAVENRMLAEMLNGAQSNDFKLVQSRGGNRRWADEEEAEAILKAARLKVDDMYTKTVVSPTNAEKLLKKDKPKVWKKVLPLITRSEGAPSIVPVSDKRPAINPQQEALSGLPDYGADPEQILLESSNLQMLNFDDLI